MPTKFRIPKLEINVNAAIASLGFTIESIEDNANSKFLIITIQETLNLAQKTQIENFIENEEKKVKWL